jgi:hypothetical protein
MSQQLHLRRSSRYETLPPAAPIRQPTSKVSTEAAGADQGTTQESDVTLEQAKKPAPLMPQHGRA